MKKESVFDRLASTETISSAKLKEKKRKPPTPNTSRAAVHNHGDVSIFERLSRQQTASSLAHHYDSDASSHEVSISSRKSTSRRPSGSSNSIFERLSRHQTSSSRGKQVASPTNNTKFVGSSPPSKISRGNNRPPLPKPQSQRSPPKINKMKKEKKPSKPHDKNTNDLSKDDPKKGITLPSLPNNQKYPKLLCSDKYNPERGYTELSPISLSLGQDLCSYMTKEIGPQQMAQKIIQALFQRDFGVKKDTRWDVDPAHAVPKDDDNIVFEAEQQATWDWKDIYSVASSKGKIRFLDNDNIIRIEGYSYYVAG